MNPRRERCVAIEDFRPVTLRDLRRGAGGRKRFNESDFCQVRVGNGPAIRVVLVRVPTNLGHRMVLPRCPTCRQIVHVLRVVPFGKGLGCQRCLRRRLAAKYSSQLKRSRPMLE